MEMELVNAVITPKAVIKKHVDLIIMEYFSRLMLLFPDTRFSDISIEMYGDANEFFYYAKDIKGLSKDETLVKIKVNGSTCVLESKFINHENTIDSLLVICLN